MDKRAQQYINWLNNWLNSRRKVFNQNYKEAHPYRYMLSSINADMELEDQLNNINNLDVYIGEPGFNELKRRGISKDYNIKNDKYYDESRFGSKNGFFNSAHNYLFFTNSGLPKAFIHELTHALSPKSGKDYTLSPQDIKIAKILSSDPLFKNNKQWIFGKYQGKDSKGNIIYKYKPDEVYARLMQLRHDFNFDPNHIWTEDEVSKQRKNWGEKNGAHYYFNNEISDKTLTRLLNEVADNNSNAIDNQIDNIYENNQSFYAKKGAKLLKRNR